MSSDPPDFLQMMRELGRRAEVDPYGTPDPLTFQSQQLAGREDQPGLDSIMQRQRRGPPPVYQGILPPNQEVRRDYVD